MIILTNPDAIKIVETIQKIFKNTDPEPLTEYEQTTWAVASTAYEYDPLFRDFISIMIAIFEDLINKDKPIIRFLLKTITEEKVKPTPIILNFISRALQKVTNNPEIGVKVLAVDEEGKVEDVTEKLLNLAKEETPK